MQRRIARIETVPPLAPGFVGPGHLAAQVIRFEDFVNNDPFIMLADDHLDIGDRTIGAAHPHAGFETVTLLLDGEIYDRDEGGTIHAGEVQWMTAGRGIIHGEHMMTKGKVRLLQLWLTLPRSRRWTTPGFQDIHADAVPIRRELYAGQPQGDPIVSYGPFIGDSRDDIVRLYAEYRAGQFEKMSELARAAAIPSVRTS
jgi:quercetin 2,3-dioxygenase